MLEPDKEVLEGIEIELNGICELCGAPLDSGIYQQDRQILAAKCDAGCVQIITGFRFGK